MAAKMSFHVDAPVKTVFDFFKDPSNQVDYGPFSGMDVHDVTMTKEGVGSFYSWKVKMLGVPLNGFEVYTEFSPDKHFTEKSSNPMVGTWAYTFEPEGSGTKVSMEHRARSFWALPGLENLTDYVVTRLSRGFMEDVKTRLESGATVPSQRKPAATRSKKAAASR